MKSINNDTKDMNNSKVAFIASEQREGGEDEKTSNPALK
jgi:hypothetical protein